MKSNNKWRVSRRGFLIGAGVLGGGVALGYAFGVPYARRKLAEVFDSGLGRPASIETTPTMWIEVTPENKVVFNIPKIEMGQGIHTALAQILAEELGASWEQVRVVQTGTASGPLDSAGTTGSTSVSSLWPVLREVAANMREMLRADAAKILGKPAAEVQIDAGVFFIKVDTQKLTFADVVKQHTGAWVVPKDKPTLKPISEFKIVGQSMQRVDLPQKIVGEATYGYDARLPGMLYGAVAMPPTIEGKLRSASVGTAEGQTGVVKVVIEKGFAGVVATSRQQAAMGVNALVLDWDEGKLWNQGEIDALIEIDANKGIVIQADGGATAQPAGDMIEARYSSPFAAHAHLEPQAALADVVREAGADKVRLWVSTQMPAFTRSDVAKALGFKEEQVEIMPTYLGGGFGRKYGSDVAIAAAKLSKAAGKPVHVGWVRKQEFQNGYLRPPTRHILRGVLNSAGQIEALAHVQSSGEVARAFLPAVMSTILGADFGATRGARLHYDGIPKRFTSAQVATLPVRTGWWRGLGLLANTFAIESFVDELAAAAKVDPLQFRLNHLQDARFRAVLEAVAEKANWGKPAPAGRAQGIAICTDGGTLCAQVAEVSVDANKKIRVHKVWSAIDPGFIINPDGVRAQTEGAITMGISSTLIEEAHIENGRVHADNFDAYPLITLRDTPEIDVTLLQSGGEPKGVGEPPIGPIAAAIGNAVFALTGQRLRDLPLRL